MNKAILSIVSISLFTFSSYAEEEKSYLKTKDAISMNVKKYFEVSSEEDTKFAENFYADNVEVFINDLVIKGKKNYITRLNKINKELIKDIKFEQLHIHTNYFSKEALAHDGKTFGEMHPNEDTTIWTNAWGTLKGVGRSSNKPISFRIHMDFRTVKGKVVEMLAYYDPTQMNEEIKALEASK